MASLSKDRGKGGTLYRLLFKSPDGERKSIRLGAVTAKQAVSILGHADHLERCAFDGSAPPTATSAWLDTTIGKDLRAKLVAKGLATAKVDDSVLTIGQLVAQFQASARWKALKPASQRNKSRSFVAIVHHFGGDVGIDSITVTAAKDFYAAMILPKADGGFGFAKSTANLVASCAYTLFNHAIEDEKLARNPFKVLPRSARKGANANVSHADSLVVLDAMVGTEDRLLFGLARWGGLRMPSEPSVLKWSDVDWERERFLVHSSKTERHEGCESRWVPIFHELKQLFQERWDEADEGEVYVLPSYAKAATWKAKNTLRGAFRRTGLSWSRMWHSLRATRQTELTARFPAHVASAWLGNTEAVARKHYLMVTDDDFKAAQKAAQTASASDSQSTTSEGTEIEKPLDVRVVA